MLFNVIISKNVYDIISLNKISNLCIETFLMIRKLITLNCSAKKVLSHHQLFFNYLTDVVEEEQQIMLALKCLLSQNDHIRKMM